MTTTVIVGGTSACGLAGGTRKTTFSSVTATIWDNMARVVNLKFSDGGFRLYSHLCIKGKAT